MNTRYFLFCAVALLLSGCIKQIAVSTVAGIVSDGFEAFTEEQDLALAEEALPANLKLLDVMLKNDPENEQLLRLVSEGYASYALGFVEDKDPERARLFYLRGRDYALRILRHDGELAKALDGSVDELRATLSKQGKDLVPAAFWASFGWGGYIYLSLSDLDALVGLPKAEALMDFVLKNDSTFYYGGAHVFLGTLYGSRPRILGGDEGRSKQHFESALRINGGKFLMTYVYYARSYAVQTLNESLFEELLATVANASLDIDPKARLANAIAKRKAELLLARKTDIF
jgi:hypothetical protein